MTNIYEDAQRYYALGWSIFPLKPNSKHPAVRSWTPFQSKRPTPKQLSRWWKIEDQGIAVVLGDVSGGLVCRDFDEQAAYDAWEREYPDLAKKLPTVAHFSVGTSTHAVTISPAFAPS